MELVSAKVPNDVLNEVEAIEEDEDITQSEAVRRVMKKGIEREKAERTDQSLSNGFLIYSAVFIAVGLVGTAGGFRLVVDASFGSLLLVFGLFGALAGLYIRREHEPVTTLQDALTQE